MSSTLDPDNIPEPDRQLGKGHGNKTLGPSDISDTGSDVQGGLRAVDDPEFGMGLDRGTNEDPDVHSIAASDDNPDSTRTGEDSTAGREGGVDLNADIGIDRIDQISEDVDTGVETAAEDFQQPQRRQDIQRQPQR